MRVQSDGVTSAVWSSACLDMCRQNCSPPAPRLRPWQKQAPARINASARCSQPCCRVEVGAYSVIPLSLVAIANQWRNAISYRRWTHDASKTRRCWQALTLPQHDASHLGRLLTPSMPLSSSAFPAPAATAVVAHLREDGSDRHLGAAQKCTSLIIWTLPQRSHSMQPRTSSGTR